MDRIGLHQGKGGLQRKEVQKSYYDSPTNSSLNCSFYFDSDLMGVRSELEFASEKRDLSVEFIFCLALIEVLKQLPVHPGHEDLVRNARESTNNRYISSRPINFSNRCATSRTWPSATSGTATPP